MGLLEWLQALAIVVPIAAMAYAGMSARAHRSERDEVQRRLAEGERRAELASKMLADLTTSLHQNDIATVRLQGEIAMASKSHDSLAVALQSQADAVGEIRRSMVTQAMFADLQASVRDLVRRAYPERRESGGRYPAQTIETPRPPRRDPP